MIFVNSSCFSYIFPRICIQELEWHFWRHDHQIWKLSTKWFEEEHCKQRRSNRYAGIITIPENWCSTTKFELRPLTCIAMHWTFCVKTVRYRKLQPDEVLREKCSERFSMAANKILTQTIYWDQYNSQTLCTITHKTDPMVNKIKRPTRNGKIKFRFHLQPLFLTCRKNAVLQPVFEFPS